MSKAYFIGDTHFGHKDVITYECRPFSSVEEMDNELIARWNNVVMPEDTVFMIGDFSFYDQAETKQICQKLKGNKILILGNHDIPSEEYYRQCGFSSVYSYPIVFQDFWLLSHKPLYLNKHMPYVNIYGHVHGNEMYQDATKHSFCACAERIKYTPISWEEMKIRMEIE